MDPDLSLLASALLRRAPGLDPDDARQYVTEASLLLGAAASPEEILRAAWEQAKADGCRDPLVAPRDVEDGDGHRTSWEATVSDQGSGQRAILTRIGLAGLTRRRRSVQPRTLLRALRRLLDRADPSQRIILWRRWGRIMAGGEPVPFRQVAHEAGVALGTAWNIEARAKHTLERLIRADLEPRSEQLTWLEDGAPAPPSPPPPQPLPETSEQLDLWEQDGV